MDVNGRSLRWEPLIIAGLTLALLVLFQPVVWNVTLLSVDYGAHSHFIQTVIDGQPLLEFVRQVPHFMYHALVWSVSRLTGTVVEASRLVALACYTLYGLALYAALRQLAGKPTTYRRVTWYVCTTIALSVANPFSWILPNNHLYLGSIAINVYHNPTMVALKPLAIVLFMLAVSRLTLPQSGLRWRWIIGAAAVTLMCIMAKPSYVIPFLPALLLLGAYRYISKQPLDGLGLLIGLVAPAVALLGLQSLIFDTSGVVFAPLGFLRLLGVADRWLPLRLLISLLFPLYVVIAYWSNARREVALQLAWLAFGFGAAAFYLLGESGRMSHGNWTWSGQITALLLFVASGAFLLRQMRTTRDIRLWVGFGILALYVIGGIMWYQVHLLPDPYAYW